MGGTQLEIRICLNSFKEYIRHQHSDIFFLFLSFLCSLDLSEIFIHGVADVILFFFESMYLILQFNLKYGCSEDIQDKLKYFEWISHQNILLVHHIFFWVCQKANILGRYMYIHRVRQKKVYRNMIPPKTQRYIA